MRQQDNEEFLAWLKRGEMKADEARELYEFCKWVVDHNACIAEVSPHEIVAADEAVERRFSPDGGLRVTHWPYLKALCAAVVFVDTTVVAQDRLAATREKLAEVDRDEIVGAILKNELLERGRAIVTATFAVDEKSTKTEAAGVTLWLVVENHGFQAFIEELDARAEEIGEELKTQQAKWKGVLSQSRYVFRRDGNYWRCRFPGDNGGAATPVENVAGMKMYRDLILEPGTHFTIVDFLPAFVDESTHTKKNCLVKRFGRTRDKSRSGGSRLMPPKRKGRLGKPMSCENTPTRRSSGSRSSPCVLTPQSKRRVTQ